jgi:hypothetical protein
VVLSPPASVVNGITEKINRWLPAHPGEAFDSEFIRRFREKVYHQLVVLGLDGAAVDIHLWRTTARAKALHNESGSELRIWDWLRVREDLQDLVRFSPHAHLPAYGPMLEAGEYYDTSGGWVYRNLGDIYNLEGLLVYLLGHTQVIRDRVSITYTGCLSPRKLKTTVAVPMREEVLCDECGSVMVHGTVDTIDEKRVIDLSDRPIIHKWIQRTYQIRAVLTAPPPGGGGALAPSPGGASEGGGIP